MDQWTKSGPTSGPRYWVQSFARAWLGRSLASLAHGPSTKTNKLGEKLKKKIPDNQRTDRIISAFAFGSLKVFATQWNLNPEEFYEVYTAYLDFGLFKGKPKKLKEIRKWWDDQVKQGKRDGDFYKVMNIGEQATKDLAAQKLGNVLILYTTIMDENIKI